MSDLIMKVEVECLAGTHIDHAAKQATDLATKLGITVRFDFNEVQCYARAGSDWRTLSANWQKVSEEKKRYPMAWSDIPSE